MNDNIIPFNCEERLLIKARGYLCAVDELIRDGDQGIVSLLKAFDCANDDLKLKIVILLGTISQPKVVWFLLDIMRDKNIGESIRQAAAIQISVMGATLKDNSKLVAELRKDLESSHSFSRSAAAFALGWRGNMNAAADLIDCLSDEDLDVQQAAVNALSNIHDDSLFFLLTQQLKKGSKEQQRSILYNLEHFPSHHGEAAEICRTYLFHSDPDLRYDAMVVLKDLSQPKQDLPLYEHCLKDPDWRVRELALMRLEMIDRSRLKFLIPKILILVSDSQARVRQAAIRLIHYINSITLADERKVNG